MTHEGWENLTLEENRLDMVLSEGKSLIHLILCFPVDYVFLSYILVAFWFSESQNMVHCFHFGLELDAFIP